MTNYIVKEIGQKRTLTLVQETNRSNKVGGAAW